jgi:hypothetical protein
VPYNDEPSTTVISVKYRCAADIVQAASSASIVAELKVIVPCGSGGEILT